MQENIISAEIEPFPNCANQAASILQRLGFRILHIGTTISVQGPESLWISVFNVAFETRKKTIMEEIKGGEVSYRKVLIENLKISSELEQLIAGVMFAEPPEFYQGQPEK